MNSTVVVAAIGLVTTGATACAVPYLQGQIAQKNTAAGRRFEQRLAVYLDAIAFVYLMLGKVDEIILDPSSVEDLRVAEPAPRNLLTAKVTLLAASDVVAAWRQFILSMDEVIWQNYDDDLGRDLVNVGVVARSVVVKAQRAADDLVELLRGEMAQ